MTAQLDTERLQIKPTKQLKTAWENRATQPELLLAAIRVQVKDLYSAPEEKELRETLLMRLAHMVGASEGSPQSFQNFVNCLDAILAQISIV